MVKDSSYVTCLESINQELYAFGNFNGWVKVYQTESPQLVMQVQISSRWLDSNCLWYICKISEHIVAITGVDGQCTILRIDDKKVLRKIAINTNEKSELVYYIKESKQLVLADK